MKRTWFLAALLVATLRCAAPVHAGQLSDYVTLQIVAHQDDDLLFMNPDLHNMIAGGYGSVTVYLTAGEATGTLDGTQSREFFAASRQEGEREAYAAMAGVENVPGAWDRSTLEVRNGNLVEVDTLVAAPHIKLVFMNLPDAGDTLPENNLALLRLYENLSPTVLTLVPTGTPITRRYSYSREVLVGSLVDLIHTFRPSVVRTLDPQPIHQGGPLPDDWRCTDPVPLDFVSDDNTDPCLPQRRGGRRRTDGRGDDRHRRQALPAPAGIREPHRRVRALDSGHAERLRKRLLPARRLQWRRRGRGDGHRRRVPARVQFPRQDLASVSCGLRRQRRWRGHRRRRGRDLPPQAQLPRRPSAAGAIPWLRARHSGGHGAPVRRAADGLPGG